MSLQVSVVVPTFNRLGSLQRMLAALARQTLAPAAFEVLAVDDGSSDGTSDWLAAQRPAHGLRGLRQENGGPARARNRGVEHARAPLIVFLDDDVEPAPELLEAHLSAHAGEEKLALLGPLGTLARYPEPWVAWEQRQLEKQYRAMEIGAYTPTYRQFWTGNASVARAEVLEAGGFDPAFLRAEDVELALRMDRRGVRFRYLPGARALHHARRSLASWCAMHESYGRLEVAIFDRDSSAEAVMAGNWARLHPSIRAAIAGSAGETGHRALRASLEGALRACARVGAEAMAQPLCSLLANVLYWRAADHALGPARAARVRALAARR